MNKVFLFISLFAFTAYSQTLEVDTTFESRCAATGSAVLSVTGGTGPYLYLVKPFGAPDAAYSTPQVSDTLVGLYAGQWTAKVVDNGTGSDVINLTIPGTYVEPSLLIDSIIVENGDPCFLGCQGKIYVSGINGRLPYLYQLRRGNLTGPIITPFQSIANFDSLCQGSYTLQIQDSCGNIKSEQSIVVGPPTTLPLGYKNFTTSSSYGSAGHVIPISCSYGSIGVFNTLKIASILRIYRGNTTTYHNGDTTQAAVTLENGLGPYKYTLKRVDINPNTHPNPNQSANLSTVNDIGVVFDANIGFSLDRIT